MVPLFWWLQEGIWCRSSWLAVAGVGARRHTWANQAFVCSWQCSCEELRRLLRNLWLHDGCQARLPTQCNFIWVICGWTWAALDGHSLSWCTFPLRRTSSTAAATTCWWSHHHVYDSSRVVTFGLKAACQAFIFNCNEVKRLEYFKYLGFELYATYFGTCHMAFHSLSLLQKKQCTPWPAHALFANFWSWATVSDSLVLPILCYASNMWGLDEKTGHTAEELQTQFLKHIPYLVLWTVLQMSYYQN